MKDTITVLAATSAPVAFNLSHVTDLITALSAFAAILYTAYKFYVEQKKRRDGKSKESK